MMKPLILAALFAVAGYARLAAAQTTDPRSSLPTWEQLSQAQRDEIVAPLRERWNADPHERQRMLERARRWHAMPPGERTRAHRGMHRWESMNPNRRAQMRTLFEHTRSMPKAQRREAMALFRVMLPMTPADREKLRQQWARMTLEQRKAWLREHAPRGQRHER